MSPTTIFYDGEFTVKRNGTKTAPITIKSYNAKITGNGRGTAYFLLLGITGVWNTCLISGYDIVVLVEGTTGNLVNGLEIRKK